MSRSSKPVSPKSKPGRTDLIAYCDNGGTSSPASRRRLLHSRSFAALGEHSRKIHACPSLVGSTVFAQMDLRTPGDFSHRDIVTLDTSNAHVLSVWHYGQRRTLGDMDHVVHASTALWNTVGHAVQDPVVPTRPESRSTERDRRPHVLESLSPSQDLLSLVPNSSVKAVSRGSTALNCRRVRSIRTPRKPPESFILDPALCPWLSSFRC